MREGKIMTFTGFVKNNKSFFILNITLMIVTAVFIALNSYITIPLIGALEQKQNSKFWIFICISLALGIISYSCKSLSDYLVEKQIQEYLIDLRKKMFKKIYYSKKNVDISVLQNDVINNYQQLGKNYILPFFTIINGIANIIVMLLTVSSISWWLSCFILISSTVTVLVSRLFSKKLAQIIKIESEYKEVLIRNITSWIPALVLVRKYKKEKFLYQKILYQSKKLEETKIRKAKVTESNDFLIDNTTNLMEVILLVIVGVLIYRKALSLGVYAAIGSFLYSILQSMKSIAYSATSIKGSKYLNDQIKQKLCIHKIEHHQSLKDFESLKFTDVTIHFENGEIIKFPDFSLKKGEKVLLSGPSGVGKSTLLRIILDLEENVSGKVTFFSSKGKILNPNLEDIGYIEQKAVLFPGSIRENITMFNESMADKINDKAKKMNFWPDIARLSEGLDTQISSINLSGGQKQKIILIRNSLADSSIFLVDEATSAIDENSRLQIIEEFLHTDATVLWIEHNLNKQIKNLFDRQIKL